jgi:hypothetical protein
MPRTFCRSRYRAWISARRAPPCGEGSPWSPVRLATSVMAAEAPRGATLPRQTLDTRRIQWRVMFRRCLDSGEGEREGAAIRD